MRISLVILFSLLFILEVFTQSAQDKSLLSPAEMQEDLDTLRSVILQTPTDPFAFIAETDFFEHLERISDSIQQPRSVIRFYQLVNPLMIQLRDIHSRIWISAKNNSYLQNGGFYLPFQIKFIDKRVYVISDPDSLIKPGSELIAINGVPALWIAARLLEEHYTDGLIANTRIQLMEENFANLLPLYYPVDSLNTLQIRSYQADKDTLLVYPGQKKNDSKKKTKQKFEEVYNLRILPDDNVAVLKIGSFAKGVEWKYRGFLKKSFKELNQANIKHLIIDIRGNKGGYIIRGPEVLSYIASDSFMYAYQSIVRASPLFRERIKYDMVVPGIVIPLFKKHIGRELVSGWKNAPGTYDTLAWEPSPPAKTPLQFRGETILLTDGLSISNSCLFHHAFARNKMGITVGNMCGCIENGTFGNSVEFVLPNSRIIGRISTIRITSTADSENFPWQGLEPDYVVPTPIESVIEGHDPQLEFVLERVRGEKQIR